MKHCDHERVVFGCEGCIDRARVIPADENGEALKLFEVEVTFTNDAHYFVFAKDEQAAQDTSTEVDPDSVCADGGYPDVRVTGARPDRVQKWSWVLTGDGFKRGDDAGLAKAEAS